MPKNPPGLVRVKGRPGYYYRDQRGGKDRLVKLSNDREDALRELRRMRGLPPSPRMPVKDAAKLWLDSWLVHRRNAKDVQLARVRVNRYLTPAMGYRPLNLVHEDDCTDYRSSLERASLKPQTVAHILADLRALLRWSERKGYIAHSPFPPGLLPKIPERVPEHLTDKEVETLTTLPEPYGFYLRLLIGSGMRFEEATRARTTDLQDGAIVIPEAKSGRVRRVPLAPSLFAEARMGRVGRLLHVTSNGSFNRKLKRVVPRFHVHMTRHTFAYRYLVRGGTIHALQSLMGHASITTTMIYLRGLPEIAEREAREVMGRA